jgi:hypothetical protein
LALPLWSVSLPLPSSCLLGYEKVDTTKAEFGRFRMLNRKSERIPSGDLTERLDLNSSTGLAEVLLLG